MSSVLEIYAVLSTEFGPFPLLPRAGDPDLGHSGSDPFPQSALAPVRQTFHPPAPQPPRLQSSETLAVCSCHGDNLLSDQWFGQSHCAVQEMLFSCLEPLPHTDSQL